MNDRLHALMREATRLTQSGRLGDATRALQRALRGDAAPPSPGPHAAEASTSFEVLDGCVFEVDTESPDASQHLEPRAEVFTNGSHAHAGLSRQYRLFVPAGRMDHPLPLVVMLHGCTQDPEDFAAGTGMNERAQEQAFFVLYPAQSRDANPSRCWNWFKHNHQRRAGGEAALIASMTRSVVQQYGIDSRRVYIAGLSAGGAMAAVVANLYPELFAALGVHSGLPSGAATSVAQALAIMRDGAPPASKSNAGQAATDGADVRFSVPTIVFHGDQDHTVHPDNGNAVIAAALPRAGGPDTGDSSSGTFTKVERGVAGSGHPYTRTLYAKGGQRVAAEHWLVHGAGHAWSGGRSAGSFTDPKGPDATAEMLRFFFEHPQTDG